MIVNSFQINDALQLVPLAPEQAEQTLQDPEARVWIDVEAFSPEELKPWLDTLDIQPLSKRLCLEAPDRSGFYPLAKEILLVLPVLAHTGDLSEIDYVSFLCRHNLLLTLHSKTIFSPGRLALIHEAETWLSDASIAGLVCAVMMDISLDCLDHNRDLRQAILALEERMDHEPDTVKAEEILELRSDLLGLGAVVSDQIPPIKGLTVINKPFFKLKGGQEYLNCALNNLQAADGSLTWLDGRISALRSGFQMHAQDKTNQRLGLLSILSAIFMPITLLAGIWGMNFETMPELKYAFSYPMALGLMILVGSGMYLHFRRTGWFD